MHSRGKCHCDLKLENIGVDVDDRENAHVVLFDFDALQDTDRRCKLWSVTTVMAKWEETESDVGCEVRDIFAVIVEYLRARGHGPLLTKTWLPADGLRGDVPETIVKWSTELM